MEKLIIIGSTGSVGCSAVEILKAIPQLYKAQLLVAHSNYKLLVKQACLLNAEYILLLNKDLNSKLKLELEVTNCSSKLLPSDELPAFLTQSNAKVLIASNGVEALEYIEVCISTGKTILLANKEALVCAGHLFMPGMHKGSKSIEPPGSIDTEKARARIIPVDSEHNALYQILQGIEPQKLKDVKELIITASGGPFYHLSRVELDKVTREDTLNHPTWSMGRIISVNSATLVNKALEVAEAYYLFGVCNVEQIKVVYHPQSLIHGAVNYTDGSLLMVAYPPNMQVSLAYALQQSGTRLQLDYLSGSILDLNNITIQDLNKEKALPIRLVQECLREKQNRLAVFNVANEVAVDAFLLGKIKFSSIINTVEYCLQKIPTSACNNTLELQEHIAFTKRIATNYISKLS